MIILCSILFIISVLLLIILIGMRNTADDIAKYIFKLEMELINKKHEYNKLFSQKKSSEVKLGHISESMAPFLDSFPYSPDDCRFLGQPIDYMVFDLENEMITFLEIKSGDSQLSKKQRQIKKLVESGKVAWDLYRIK